MAGFDLDLQHAGNVPGLGWVESGVFDISSGSRTVEVPTRLTTCNSGMGMADMSTVNNTTFLTTDRVITSSFVTFKRHGAFIGEDVRFSYFLTGY
jgi:hypothetical protein